jgi:hypothetical protein
MKYYKYPRTPHLPWSPGKTNDDKVLKDTSHFLGKEIVMSLKMDGEATTLYSNHMHARSIDSKDHPSRHWLKALHSAIRGLIPACHRVCGENLYARHSISYNVLLSYFQVYSIWDEKNECLPWDITTEKCNHMGLITVPVVWRGTINDDLSSILQALFEPYEKEHEGYVIRTADSFPYDEFGTHIAKYVRKNHVQTDEHWLNQSVVKNKLKL